MSEAMVKEATEAAKLSTVYYEGIKQRLECYLKVKGTFVEAFAFMTGMLRLTAEVVLSFVIQNYHTDDQLKKVIQYQADTLRDLTLMGYEELGGSK
jgi:hypothetical protein